MDSALSRLSLVDGLVPIVIYSLSAVAFLVLVATRSPRRGVLTLVAAAVGGGAVGWVLGWLVSDVWNSFGVSLSLPTRLWFAGAVAAISVAAMSFYRAGLGRRVLAGFSVLLFALMGGIGINADIGEFPTFGDLFGASAARPLALPSPSRSAQATPADMPLKGTVGTVIIPATVSHFAARDAIVYLPPAALLPDAPALPVLEMLSGQPGSPSSLVTAGQLPEIFDSYARSHHGLAPIVVIPDQLGAPQNNPMCVDSPLGDSASYLTVDVPNWIRAHLKVLTGPGSWAIGGFSEGGTCSIQLGARYPELYGSILDISGQLAPQRGSLAETIHDAFGGSAARYDAATPLALLSAGRPYKHSFAIFASGQDDTRFGPAAVTVARAAAAAGMAVHSLVSPGTAHDWHTVQYSLEKAVVLLGAHWRLT